MGHQEAQNNNAEVAVLTVEELMQHNTLSSKAELHWRITLILAVPIMALLAVPLSKVNPRQGRFAKIVPALLLYLIYFLAQSSLKSAGGAGKLDAAILMPLVNILFLGIGILLNTWNSLFMYKLRYLLTRNTAV